MPVKVKIPTPLQRLTNGKEEVEGEPGTIMDLINSRRGFLIAEKSEGSLMCM
jgi:hypothetical protein